jgi:hypothetical protein
VEDVLCPAHAADQQRARLVDPQARQQQGRDQCLSSDVLVTRVGAGIEHPGHLDQQRHLVDREVRLDRTGNLEQQARLARPVGHLRRVVKDVRVVKDRVQRVDRAVQTAGTVRPGQAPAPPVHTLALLPQVT